MSELGVPPPPRGGIEPDQLDTEGNAAQQDQNAADPTASVLPPHDSTDDLRRDRQPSGTVDPLAGDRPMTGEGTGASGGYGTGSGFGSSGGSPDGSEGEPAGTESDWLRGEDTPEAIRPEDARDA